MRKFFTFYLFFCLFFTPVIVFSTNSYAENNAKFLFLLKELGLGHLSFLNQQPISDVPQGRVIKCRVTDPEKLGVFRESEWATLPKNRVTLPSWEMASQESSWVGSNGPKSAEPVSSSASRVHPARLKPTRKNPVLLRKLLRGIP